MDLEDLKNSFQCLVKRYDWFEHLIQGTPWMVLKNSIERDEDQRK